MPVRGIAILLSQEAKKFPGVVNVITGRFARNPDLYYELRFVRVAEDIKKSPENLALYDDLGVACDKIEEGEKAILWMKSKKQMLDRLKKKLPEDDWYTHLYRYHANIGTFIIHKWLRDGGLKFEVKTAKIARDHIVKAIQINANAHFGRERYQLMAIDWIIRTIEGELTTSGFLRDKDEFDQKMRIISGGDDDPVRGLTGMIVLGNAWQSIDIFNNLGYTLQGERSASLAQLAFLRSTEIRKAGGKSFSREDSRTSVMLEGKARKENVAFFKAARTEADKWLAARTGYMEEQFAKGKHPDTDADFWAEANYAGSPPKFRGEKVQ